jgi:hypothetical protein
VLVEAAALLTKLAETLVTVAMLKRDLEAGAPRNADGTLNLVHYAAWLAREAKRAVQNPVQSLHRMPIRQVPPNLTATILWI